nr:hypothetical protein [Tanacetum cinerariifolium]
MTTLAKHVIVAGVENRPPMFEKSMYDSWASRIRLFIKGKKHDRMMLDSIDNGLLVYPTVEENGHRPKKYFELTEAQKLQDDCDVQTTNIILRGLPHDVLYNLFDKFAHVPGSRGIATTSKGNVTVGPQRVVKCYNCQGERHMARHCTQPKMPRNVAWFMEKLMLAEAQEAGQILDEEQLAFLADLGISEAPVANQIVPQNLAVQTDDLDAYDLDCDDLFSAKAVLMADLLRCDPEVLSEVLIAVFLPC